MDTPSPEAHEIPTSQRQHYMAQSTWGNQASSFISICTEVFDEIPSDRPMNRVTQGWRRTNNLQQAVSN
jgi:hypothetical protein